MQKHVCARPGRRVLGLFLVGSILCGGCDSGSNKTEMVKPEVAPEVAGKASMDAYLKAQPQKKGSAPGAPGKR